MHIEVTNSFGRHGFHREEIASPERFAVTIQEVGPGVGRAIRAGFDAVFLQDVAARSDG